MRSSMLRFPVGDTFDLSFFSALSFPDRDRSCRARAKQNEGDLFWGAEAVKQSSKSVRGARQSGSKSLSPVVNGKAYLITVFWRKLVRVALSLACSGSGTRCSHLLKKRKYRMFDAQVECDVETT